MLRAVKWTLLIVAVLLDLVAVSAVISLASAPGRLQALVAKMKAAGEPVEMADLAKPPIPDAENGAIVYRQALQRLQDPDLIADLLGKTGSLGNPQIAAAIWDFLRRNGETLRLLHEAASMPKWDFRLDWNQGYDLLASPQWQQLASDLRRCCRLLSLQTRAFLQAGRVDEAIQACAANFDLARGADEPLLIHQLTRFTVIAIASSNLEEVLRDSMPSEQVCRSLAAELQGIDLLSSYIAAMKGERAIGLSSLRVGPTPRNFLGDWFSAYLQLGLLQGMEETVRNAQLPYRQVAVTHVPAKGRRKFLTPWRVGRILAGIMDPMYYRAQATRDRAIAGLSLDRVALLLKGYKARHGTYPETLEKLQDYAGHPLPEDPFSGKPFAYLRQRSGFVVYSWGPNLKDDGGIPPPAGKWQEGVIVFRCVR